MKNLHLYGISILVSYWSFSAMNNVNIFTFIAPIFITYFYLRAGSAAEIENPECEELGHKLTFSDEAVCRRCGKMVGI